MNKMVFMAVASASALALTACEDAGSSAPPAPAPTPASVDCEPVVHPTTGETLAMEVVLRDTFGNVLSRRPLGADEECP